MCSSVWLGNSLNRFWRSYLRYHKHDFSCWATPSKCCTPLPCAYAPTCAGLGSHGSDAGKAAAQSSAAECLDTVFAEPYGQPKLGVSCKFGRLMLILIQGECQEKKNNINVFDATRLPRNVHNATREILFAFCVELGPRAWQTSFWFSAGGLLLAWLQATRKSQLVVQQVGSELTALWSWSSPSPRRHLGLMASL